MHLARLLLTLTRKSEWRRGLTGRFRLGPTVPRRCRSELHRLPIGDVPSGSEPCPCWRTNARLCSGTRASYQGWSSQRCARGEPVQVAILLSAQSMYGSKVPAHVAQPPATLVAADCLTVIGGRQHPKEAAARGPADDRTRWNRRRSSSTPGITGRAEAAARSGVIAPDRAARRPFGIRSFAAAYLSVPQ